ncbi:MAG: glycosyltransferase family A protein, partial [Patescibacteria group bacterium]
MVDKNTDFFKYVDNFAKTVNIASIPIFEFKSNRIPKITIGIPTYKRTDLLKEAIESAINQIGYKDYDIIVVDNNPLRGCETEKMMLNYRGQRISYYKNVENIQMAGNWNRLYTLAKGEYVVMLHDDDMLHNDYLLNISNFISKYNNKFDAIYPAYN